MMRYMARGVNRGMKKGILLIGLAVFSLVCLQDGAFSAEEPSGMVAGRNVAPSSDTGLTDCGKMVELLQQQKELISRETGQLKREIASLREELLQPGIKEIFAGIGYIFGLAGLGIYISNRKNRRAQ